MVFKIPFPKLTVRAHGVFICYNSFYLFCKECFSAFEWRTKNKVSLKSAESHWKGIRLILPVLWVPLGLLLFPLKGSPYWVQRESGQSLCQTENSLHRTACTAMPSSASELLLQSQHRLSKWIWVHLAAESERSTQERLVRVWVAHFVDCRIWLPELLTLHILTRGIGIL